MSVWAGRAVKAVVLILGFGVVFFLLIHAVAVYKRCSGDSMSISMEEFLFVPVALVSAFLLGVVIPIVLALLVLAILTLVWAVVEGRCS